MGNAESIRALLVSGGSGSGKSGVGFEAPTFLVNYEYVRDIQRQIQYSTRNPTAYLITTLGTPAMTAKTTAPETTSSSHEWYENRMVVPGRAAATGWGGGGAARSSLTGPLIAGTLAVQEEEDVVNRLIDSGNFVQICLVIYGQDCSDARVIRKYKQLVEFGFTNVKMYMGGMFEWLLLQECFGDEFFPTSGPRRHHDILTLSGSSSS